MELKETLLNELYREVPTLGRMSALRLAERILELVDRFYPPRRALKPGQLRWPAIRLTDGPGRRVEHTALQPVTLDIVLAEPWGSGQPIQQRTRVAVALFEQARAQGALLTTVDVGAILCRSAASVAAHVRAHQRAGRTVVPTRGTVHDIGPGVTHRLIICEKLLVEGQAVEQTARETHHCVRAVTRYLRDFRRVHFCLQAGLTVDQTVQLTRLSATLVRKCQLLRDQLAHRLDHPDQLAPGDTR